LRSGTFIFNPLWERRKEGSQEFFFLFSVIGCDCSVCSDELWHLSERRVVAGRTSGI
jgi:hypothetical protein